MTLGIWLERKRLLLVRVINRGCLMTITIMWARYAKMDIGFQQVGYDWGGILASDHSKNTIFSS